MITKSNNLKNKEAGFTLIEFLIYSVITSAMIAALILISVNISRGEATGSAMEEVSYNGRVTGKIITSTIRKAEEIIHPTEGASDDELELKMTDSEEDPTIFEINEDGRLTIQRGTDEPNNLLSKSVEINQLIFTNVSRSNKAQAARVEYEIGFHNPLNRPEYDLQQEFSTTEALRK